MIEIAKEETPAELDVCYRVGNLHQISEVTQEVDFITCNYVLENIENIASAFSTFYSVLKPLGTCIFSISHPLRAMAIREKTKDKETWTLENYFDKGTRISDLGEGLKVKKYKKTISDYLNACIEAGFKIEKCLEPQPIQEGSTCDPRAHETSMRLPQLLVVKMIKA